jgi:hypothetical protein
MQAFHALVKSQETRLFVIPAKAGIQGFQEVLDPGFRRGDGFGDFLRGRQPFTHIFALHRGP